VQEKKVAKKEGILYKTEGWLPKQSVASSMFLRGNDKKRLSGKNSTFFLPHSPSESIHRSAPKDPGITVVFRMVRYNWIPSVFLGYDFCS
jgi:hypothetical protein